MIRIGLIALSLSMLGACAAAPGAGHPTLASAEKACADAGVAPGSGGFSRCVTNLDETMRSDANRPG
jgi:hypothetical protein